VQGSACRPARATTNPLLALALEAEPAVEAAVVAAAEPGLVRARALVRRMPLRLLLAVSIVQLAFP
jgi:hypothetical protein